MDAEATVRDYYRALRAGETLAPYFARDPSVVKFGVGERLTGFEEVAAALEEQVRTTDAWTVDSRRLAVAERDRHAWFSDDVFLAWTDTERNIRFEFDTRWSGTLERREPASRPSEPGGDGATGDGTAEAGDPDEAWRFVGMHVSTAAET